MTVEKDVGQIAVAMGECMEEIAEEFAAALVSVTAATLSRGEEESWASKCSTRGWLRSQKRRV